MGADRRDGWIYSNQEGKVSNVSDLKAEGWASVRVRVVVWLINLKVASIQARLDLHGPKLTSPSQAACDIQGRVDQYDL